MHGMYHWQIEEVVDIKKTQLEKARLRDSTEAPIMAAQEQALNRIDRGRGLPPQTGPKVQTLQLCSLDSPACNSRVQNASRKGILRASQPSSRHSIQRHLCLIWAEGPRTQWAKPSKMSESDRTKILQGFQIHTDTLVVATSRISQWSTSGIRSNRCRNPQQQKHLEEGTCEVPEIPKAERGVVKASVVPVVIIALRAVTPRLGEWLQQIPLSREVQSQEQLKFCTGLSGSQDLSLKETHGRPQRGRVENVYMYIYRILQTLKHKHLLVGNLFEEIQLHIQRLEDPVWLLV